MKNVKTFSSFKEMRDYLEGGNKNEFTPKEAKPKKVEPKKETKATPKKSSSKKGKK